MREHFARPGKILIAFIGRRRGDILVEAAKKAGARGGTILMGKTTHDNWFLQALSLADVQQDVVYFVMTGEAANVTAAVKAAGIIDPGKMGGYAIVLDVPEMFLRICAANPGDTPAQPLTRSETMESGYKLINVIVNTGYAEDVMAAARKAGARGGTILTARGTGTEEDVKFFGITLVPEKELLLIVAEKDKVQPIIDEITTVPTLCEPGGGIVFNMNVEEFIALGK
jgi:nitrogen regulatory protein PII